jgi:hypothetical protein
MNGSGTAVLAAVAGFVVGAVTASGVNDYLGVAVAITGLFVGVSRYGAVLQGASKPGVERATGVGFFVGLLVSAIVIAYLAVR